MKISELIQQLLVAKETHGDVQVDMACAEEPQSGGLSTEIYGLAYFANGDSEEVNCVTICDFETMEALADGE